MSIQYHYYGKTGLVKGHSGIIVAATQMKNNKLHIGYSFCCKKSIYSKQFGRDAAKREMENDPVLLDLPQCTDAQLAEFIAKSVVKYAFISRPRNGKQYYPPQWVKRLLTKHLLGGASMPTVLTIPEYGKIKGL